MNGYGMHGKFTGIIFAQENAYLIGAMMQGFQVNNPFARKKPRAKRDEPRRKRPELFPHLAKIERGINPDTGKPFLDRRSCVRAGRVICKGSDMKDLRERVARREGEICQHCEEWAQLYPPEGHKPGELHHVHGRGMGGAKRDDRASEMEWLCNACHRNAKIKRRDFAGLPEGV